MQGGIITEMSGEFKRFTPVNTFQKPPDFGHDIEALRTNLQFYAQHCAAEAVRERFADELYLKRCPQIHISSGSTRPLPHSGEHPEHAAHQLPVTAASGVSVSGRAGMAGRKYTGLSRERLRHLPIRIGSLVHVPIFAEIKDTNQCSCNMFAKRSATVVSRAGTLPVNITVTIYG